ncbi:MAG: hypothetical protein KDA45_05215 [Planctomycetales bacterium]|nr:hypothetical protein [Planctomycetales bacterium]
MKPRKQLGNPDRQRWPTLLLASSAILFLSGGLLANMLPGIDDSSRKYAAGTLLKVGVVLGLTWLASPQLERLGWHKVRGTMLGGIILVLVLYAVRPKIGAIAASLLIAGSLLFSLLGWFRAITGPPRRH